MLKRSDARCDVRLRGAGALYRSFKRILRALQRGFACLWQLGLGITVTPGICMPDRPPPSEGAPVAGPADIAERLGGAASIAPLRTVLTINTLISEVPPDPGSAGASGKLLPPPASTEAACFAGGGGTNRRENLNLASSVNAENWHRELPVWEVSATGGGSSSLIRAVAAGGGAAGATKDLGAGLAGSGAGVGSIGSLAARSVCSSRYGYHVGRGCPLRRSLRLRRAKDQAIIVRSIGYLMDDHVGVLPFGPDLVRSHSECQERSSGSPAGDTR